MTYRGPQVLTLDAEREVERVAIWLRQVLADDLRRRGAIVAVSGGVDSAVCAALAVRALGPDRVLALLLPETESSADSLTLGLEVVRSLGVPHLVMPIGAILEAAGCYRRRDAAIARLVPGYASDWKSKLTISKPVAGGFSFYRLVVEDPAGHRHSLRLPADVHRDIMAATNLKQRVRKMLEYTEADRLHYAVIGTPNRLEFDQGFFVKNGDGAADVKPIAHLYKTQVYRIAEHLGMPAAVLAAEPTTDTFTLPQGQDESFFALPYADMDQALWAYHHDVPAATLAQTLGRSREAAEAIYSDIAAKRRASRYLHAGARLIDEPPDVGAL